MAHTEGGRVPIERAPRRRTTVLVVDDEPAFQETVARYLSAYRRLTAYNGWQALQVLAKHHVDVVILDLNLPDTTGLELLRQIRAERDDVEIIIVTSQAEVRNAATCIRAGAFDFVAKSYENYQQMSEHVQRALEHRRRRRADMLTRSDENVHDVLALLEETNSDDMAAIGRLLREVARTPLPILLEGESGVGKELLARYVHLLSDRASHPFVPVAVAQIPPTLLVSTLFGHEKGSTGRRQRLGKFELAEGGTLYLQGIDELGAGAQLKLFHALERREIERISASEPSPVDVRLIAATNQELGAEVSSGRFREDLWQRLNVLRVRVPPLRERRADIPRLAQFFAARYARAMGRAAPKFTGEALEALTAYRWLGNVRELESVMARMLAVSPGPTLGMAEIPVEYCVEHLAQLGAREAEPASRSMYAMASAHFERFFVRHMVESCGGNRGQAAQRMGISYETVENVIEAPARTSSIARPRAQYRFRRVDRRPLADVRPAGVRPNPDADRIRTADAGAERRHSRGYCVDFFFVQLEPDEEMVLGVNSATTATSSSVVSSSRISPSEPTVTVLKGITTRRVIIEWSTGGASILANADVRKVAIRIEKELGVEVLRIVSLVDSKGDKHALDMGEIDPGHMERIKATFPNAEIVVKKKGWLFGS